MKEIQHETKPCGYCSYEMTLNTKVCPMCRRRERDLSGRHIQLPIVARPSIPTFSRVGRTATVVIAGRGNAIGHVSAETTSGVFVQFSTLENCSEWFPLSSEKVNTFVPVTVS